MTFGVRFWLAIVLCALAAGMHLAACEWRAIDFESGKGITAKDAWSSDADLQSSEDSLNQAAQALGHALGDIGAVWYTFHRSLFMRTDENGKGFAVFARAGLEKDVSRWLGVIFPVMMVVWAVLLVCGLGSARPQIVQSAKAA